MGVKQEKKGKTVDKERFLGKQPALPLRAQAWQTKKKEKSEWLDSSFIYLLFH